MEQSNHGNTALLVMDVQGPTIKMLTDSTPIIQALTKAIRKARSNNVPVIYVVIGYRKGFPEVRRDSKTYAVLKTMNMDTEESTNVHESVTPQAGDIIVTKKRVSAFTGSDLEVVLRTMGVNHLVLTGVATSGVVLSTLCEAVDKDYKITVLSDCCADRDDEVHRVITTKVFTRRADVIKGEEWSAST
jgi:nicotinamidase-related amidase